MKKVLRNTVISLRKIPRKRKLIWSDVIGFEKLYIISNEGHILSRYTGKLLKSKVSKRGYYNVKLYKNKKQFTKKIHRLIAEAFIPNPENKPQINHKNGNKLDNSLENLEWCNNFENAKHAHETGLRDNSGSKNGMSKLTDKIISSIRKDCCSDMTQNQIAKKYGISQANVSMIKNNKRWKNH